MNNIPVKVYGGTGKEPHKTDFVDEFGNCYRGTGHDAKSYYRGRHQTVKIVFIEE